MHALTFGALGNMPARRWMQTLTFGALGEHAGEALDADLQLHIPDSQHLVLGEADELTTWLVELHLDDRRHVTAEHLHDVTGNGSL